MVNFMLLFLILNFMINKLSKAILMYKLERSFAFTGIDWVLLNSLITYSAIRL